MAINKQNLIPLNQRSAEERRRITSEGGKASAAARKKKKMLSEYLNVALNSPIRNEKVLQYTIDNFEFKEDDLNHNACVVRRTYRSGSKRQCRSNKVNQRNDKR